MAGHKFGHLFLCWRHVTLVLLLREDDVRALLPMTKAVELVEDAFRLHGRGEAVNRPRARIPYPHGLFHFMAGSIEPSHSVGLKAYAAGRAGACFVVLLFDEETSRLLSILEADWLGRIRTGAASGVATRQLARPDARVAGVIGAGGQTETQIEAMCAVRELEEVKIFSRTPERREALVSALAGRLGPRFVAVDSAEKAVRGSDIITTITTAREPVFDGSWLGDGTHINAAGSNQAQRSEIDPLTVDRSDVVAVDSMEQARLESGDLIEAASQGQLDWERVVELGAVVAGNAPGRTAPGDITLFESQGIAIEDIAVARHVYERALQENLGQRVEFGGPL